MGDSLKTGLPFRRGDGVFERGRGKIDDFPPQRRGNDSLLVKYQIAAFFQRFENLCAGGLSADALGFLKSGFGVSISHKTMDIGHRLDERTF